MDQFPLNGLNPKTVIIRMYEDLNRTYWRGNICLIFCTSNSNTNNSIEWSKYKEKSKYLHDDGDSIQMKEHNHGSGTQEYKVLQMALD